MAHEWIRSLGALMGHPSSLGEARILQVQHEYKHVLDKRGFWRKESKSHELNTSPRQPHLSRTIRNSDSELCFPTALLTTSWETERKILQCRSRQRNAKENHYQGWYATSSKHAERRGFSPMKKNSSWVRRFTENTPIDTAAAQTPPAAKPWSVTSRTVAGDPMYQARDSDELLLSRKQRNVARVNRRAAVGVSEYRENRS